jgi:hypothetical protein
VAPVPTGASTGPVTVTVGGATSNGVTFTVTPSISSLTPTSGSVGSSVTIKGSNFGTVQGTGLVAFNGSYATVSSWTGTNIVASVPPGTTTGPVTVTVNGIGSNGVQFTIGTGAISGTVSNAGNAAGIAGAQVQALQANTVVGSASSASDGTYSIPNLAAGIYDVSSLCDRIRDSHPSGEQRHCEFDHYSQRGARFARHSCRER